MVLLKQLVLILMFNVVGLDAFSCPKGSKVVLGKHLSCKACSEGYYQPEENDSQECIPCTPCDEDSGSEIKHKCTRETNTVCQCRVGFVTWDTDDSTCKCDKGFGRSEHKPYSCLKCEEGYFNPHINTPCRKWKTCKSTGVKMNGTPTSDVVCNAELRKDSDVATPPTPNKGVSLTSVMTHRPHEGARTLSMITVHTTTTAPQRTTHKDHEQTFQPSNTGNRSGWTFVILGVAGLLVILTAVTCKLHIIPCWQRKITGGLQTKDSTCRRPVEESGDGSELSLKQNPEEP